MPANLDILRPALEAAGTALGLMLEAWQTDALLAYLGMLERWNATYNLTSVRDPAQMLTQHLADCLAVIRPLRREWSQSPGRAGATPRVLDVGSGGGLPGIVIALMNPQASVVCVDAVGKKAAFIQQVAGELRLHNLRAEHARVEQLRSPAFDVITSRAFSSLADLIRLSERHLAPRGVWMAMKGRYPTEELAQVSAHVSVFHVEPLRVPHLDAERCLVWLRPDRQGQAPAGRSL